METDSKSARHDWGRIVANLATLVVGGVAGYLSWRHLRDLGTDAGLDKMSAMLTAVPIDGMIVVGTLQLRAARRVSHPAHWSAYGCLLVGVAATVAGNIAAAPPAHVWARVIYGFPPVAFLFCVEAVFGKPLTRNLWDVLRGWAHRSRPVAATPQPESASVPVKTIPEPPAQRPEKPVVVQPAKPASPPADDPQPRPQGVHKRLGREAEDARRAQALSLMLASMTPDRPSGMTAAELAARLSPPLGRRTAEAIAARARQSGRPADPAANGHRGAPVP